MWHVYRNSESSIDGKVTDIFKESESASRLSSDSLNESAAPPSDSNE